jgi:hypothetical protein
VKGEKEFDLVEFVRFLDRKKILYLLIGRWAVILHGAPLMTADYDFWIDSAGKETLLRLLEKEDYEVPPESQWKQPILTVYAGPEKIDFFFARKVTNREGERLEFSECWKRSDVKEDPRRSISLRVPSIDDLITLKKMPRKSREEEQKDATDVRFLKAIKRAKD